MLNLVYNNEIIQSVNPDTVWFLRLPNGDFVSPVLAGWSNDEGYSLVEVVPDELPPDDQSNNDGGV